MMTGNKLIQMREQKRIDIRQCMCNAANKALSALDNVKNKHVVLSPATHGLVLTLFNKGARPTVYSLELDTTSINFCRITLDTISMRDGHRCFKTHYSICNTSNTNKALIETIVELASQPCDGSQEDTDAHFIRLGLLYSKRDAA